MSESEIKLMIEQIGYKEFYRYYEEKEKYIEKLEKEIKGLKGLRLTLITSNKAIKKENKRLNNIIDELEKWLDKKEKLTFNSWNKGIHEVQRKLQEPKGSDK